jgi:hypothetical protein
MAKKAQKMKKGKRSELLTSLSGVSKHTEQEQRLFG